MKTLLKSIYKKIIINHPIITLIVITSIIAFFGYHTPKFHLDASADSLILENDQTLKYYRAIKARYGTDDFLIATYAPQKDLFEQTTLTDLENLQEKLKKIQRVDTVTSILSVPLINSPHRTLNELSTRIYTLKDQETDINLARQELTTSPLYKNLVISADGKTTALIINFKRDPKWIELLTNRNILREQAIQNNLTPENQKKLTQAEKAFKQHNKQLTAQQQKDIAQVRTILNEHRNNAEIYLGGIPMITTDSIDYIRNDLKTFGITILIFCIALLFIIFRNLRWVILPIITCASVGIIMVGILGLIGWPVTVVSSNFVSLLLIITLSLTVHLIVRYRETQTQQPQADKKTLITYTTEKMAKPCFYTALTTIVAFSSLIVSNIRPIIDFGWMMAIGTSIAFVMAFTLFPAAVMLLPTAKPPKHNQLTNTITQALANIIQQNKASTLIAFTLLIIWSIWGITHLSVENRFIDYYKKHTEIYQGMETIDQKLGGTTPLEIIIDAPKQQEQSIDEMIQEEDDFYADDELYEEEDTPTIADGHWFNGHRFDEIAQIHKYLDNLPETGKTLSLHTTIKLLQTIEKDATDPLHQTILLSALYNKTPKTVQETLFKPYISEDGNQLRYDIRIYETKKGLKRQQLIDKIQNHLTNNLGYLPEQINITGMLVLYNNMLQSLFKSQILTIGFVFIAIFIMFLISFRNFTMATIAIIPNIAAAMLVLGIMGWFGIPLDIMTITIAAICIGIAVDNAIHYIHRYTTEYKKDANAWETVNRTHNSIGHAMFYTGITIILGFSILTASNFVPTIYFGLLTAFSMLIALISNLTLLPLLIALIKPLKTP